MRRTALLTLALVAMLLVKSTNLRAGTVEFELLTHPDNVGLLPQPKGQVTVSGDHLLHTVDDISGSTFNPDGCISFNFMNPVGISEPDYPPGYAEGIHSVTGSFVLDIDLDAGGPIAVDSLALDAYVALGKPIAHQRLVQPGDPATDGTHGPIDGMTNSGTYAATAAANWAFNANFDWYYDTPFAGSGGIDMTFDDYQWNGFIIPVSELTTAGMSATSLDDPLDYFGGNFESWLLNQLSGQLPQEAVYLLFAQGETHPDWTSPKMGMTPEGIVGETIIAYAVPEPATMILLAIGFCWAKVTRRRRLVRGAKDHATGSE